MLSHETTKILEENIGNKISDIFHSNIFADMSLRAREKKENKQKGLHQTKKNLCTVWETISKMKRHLTVWENIFASDTSDNRLIPNIYKSLIKLNIRKTKNPIKNYQRPE